MDQHAGEKQQYVAAAAIRESEVAAAEAAAENGSSSDSGSGSGSSDGVVDLDADLVDAVKKTGNIDSDDSDGHDGSLEASERDMEVLYEGGMYNGVKVEVQDYDDGKEVGPSASDLAVMKTVRALNLTLDDVEEEFRRQAALGTGLNYFPDRRTVFSFQARYFRYQQRSYVRGLPELEARAAGQSQSQSQSRDKGQGNGQEGSNAADTSTATATATATATSTASKWQPGRRHVIPLRSRSQVKDDSKKKEERLAAEEAEKAAREEKEEEKGE
jgi:hypothetical protein